MTSALEAVLASPYFIFRLERETEGRPEHRRFAWRTWTWRRACRSSSGARRPTRSCWICAAAGRLVRSCVCSRRRRAGCWPTPVPDALGSRFAAQWLRLQDVDKVHPDPNFYPNFDENLADAMRRETVMFFNSLVKDDRSLLELLPGRLHVRRTSAWRSTTASRTWPATSSGGCSTRTRRGAGCSVRAPSWCRPRWPTALRRCCAASGCSRCWSARRRRRRRRTSRRSRRRPARRTASC